MPAFCIIRHALPASQASLSKSSNMTGCWKAGHLKAGRIMHLLLQGVMTVFTELCSYAEKVVKLFIPKKTKSLSGEIVLITGAAHGLGRGTAYAFSKHGCKLVLWDINKRGVEETADQCRKLGAVVHTYVVNCQKREEIYRTADEVKKDVGDISILINNAGVITTGHLLSVTDEQIQSMFDVNVFAQYWTVKAFLPAMIEMNHGHIVTIASSAGFLSVPFMVTYSSSKHALVGFHHSLTEELYFLGKDGIKTTCLCPSFINTGFVKDLLPKTAPVLETEYTVNKLMEGILTNQEMIVLPLCTKLFIIMLRFLPQRAWRYFIATEREWIGNYRDIYERSK
ncbi:PREDICTED: 17-beta-hydroxysteroid dehydrogenase 13-like [Gekko japonicus]|uniref:Estradiol 17-beta-dehydrogenase 11 n=1 Tax=Gekko japonicus TaxID=146911 RepID=A0ABM1K8J6_GEKJA|nr:PREDICTED: 17-beta-hydroxysteroid dehydrogenase 13-like [Gekko japonicus]